MCRLSPTSSNASLRDIPSPTRRSRALPISTSIAATDCLFGRERPTADGPAALPPYSGSSADADRAAFVRRGISRSMRTADSRRLACSALVVSIPMCASPP